MSSNAVAFVLTVPESILTVNKIVKNCFFGFIILIYLRIKLKIVLKLNQLNGLIPSEVVEITLDCQIDLIFGNAFIDFLDAKNVIC
jgi:hypothetical protein